MTVKILKYEIFNKVEEIIESGLENIKNYAIVMKVANLLRIADLKISDLSNRH